MPLIDTASLPWPAIALAAGFIGRAARGLDPRKMACRLL